MGFESGVRIPPPPQHNSKLPIIRYLEHNQSRQKVTYVTL